MNLSLVVQLRQGEEWRTRDRVRYYIDNSFGTSANGLPGNDDCGTLSAWLVFAMMGIYPDCPGNANYQTALPVFDRVEISLNQAFYNRKKLVIGKKDNEIVINGRKAGSVVSHRSLTINSSSR
ncbi:MAG: glycoside hydrolase family 92 protein [Acidobacteria bacterium]|nr:glycoside hydrolase family 92 protein [Acidobacteriota bacterium]